MSTVCIITLGLIGNITTLVSLVMHQRPKYGMTTFIIKQVESTKPSYTLLNLCFIICATQFVHFGRNLLWPCITDQCLQLLVRRLDAWKGGMSSDSSTAACHSRRVHMLNNINRREQVDLQLIPITFTNDINEMSIRYMMISRHRHYYTIYTTLGVACMNSVCWCLCFVMQLPMMFGFWGSFSSIQFSS
jgi:hypothetical protein